ncbi:metallophosphoesterase [Asticcacaulis sp. ZE23SCel15]|uniref:metallophosphoesterase n=1 Tax=Asticcacaulis sp. ZE23SCel15 TaxID=3059027 RepID=UPI00265FA6F7|nr:metallophosphoesterase [Asticcacaulis sp. ZE23SCel15]WKL57643.1 metallophosphoesterase [Asticcacaulis sp. ZE23SCel15]
MLNIFHISDLHYSAEDGQVRDAAVAAAGGILRLAEELKSKGILGRNTCVCITGDLVQTGENAKPGKASDFEAVQEHFLAPLLDILKISPDRVFIVPGNHEMDRNAVPEENRITIANHKKKPFCELDLHADLCSKLQGYFKFIERNGYKSVSIDSPRVANFTIDGQPIVCINGLVGSYSGGGAKDKGELFLLSSELGGVLTSIPNFSIVLTHHPFSWFADSCGTDLKEFLSARKCRLLTGHIHDRGVEWVEGKNGSLVIVQAGAAAEDGKHNDVAVGWYPASNSAAVRHYSFDARTGMYPPSDVNQTQVAPQTATAFFQRTEAFFEPKIWEEARQKAYEDCRSELCATFGRDPDKYISPDIVIYSEDEFSAKRTNTATFANIQNCRVISGDELSGKTSFMYHSAMRANISTSGKINIVLDFRALSYDKDISGMVEKKLQSFGLTKHQCAYVTEIGLIELWFDNFDANDTGSLQKFTGFFAANPSLVWNIAVRGGQRYLPSRAPASFPKDGISYFELSELTLPTVLKMIQIHEFGANIERPRGVVERVFRSINNLRAPRTVFYVNNLVDMFLSDGSVEPLNRYLLIENLLSEKIRDAYKINVPGQPVDMEMLDTFLGQISYYLMDKEQPYISKAEYYTLADAFIDKKGLQRKRFNPDLILNVLTDSFVLRDYDGSYGFMMISVEDYFLAKHMGRDEAFRKSIMSPDGLLTLPNVAEYYIAQNPSDTIRIAQIFDIIDDFKSVIAPLIDQMRDVAINSIRNAAPGNATKIQDELIEILAEVETDSDDALVVSEKPKQLGKTRRVKFSLEERFSVLLQLGASILGVTRTLDQSERILIFEKIRDLLLISFYGAPMIARYLAEGGEVKLRGVPFKAEYVGALAVQDDRFYIILRGMLYNIMKHFSTWAGSPSFFNAAVKLRSEEPNELIIASLFAQNIEADLSDSIQFIPDITKSIDSMVLKEIVVRLFADAMTLVPLERADERKAVDSLVDATLEINPPKNLHDAARVERHKTRIRQDFVDRIGLNTYIGKMVRSRK